MWNTSLQSGEGGSLIPTLGLSLWGLESQCFLQCLARVEQFLPKSVCSVSFPFPASLARESRVFFFFNWWGRLPAYWHFLISSFFISDSGIFEGKSNSALTKNSPLCCFLGPQDPRSRSVFSLSEFPYVYFIWNV